MIETYDPNSTPVVILTEKAIKHFKAFVKKREGAVGIRISLKKNGCSGLSYVNETVTEVPEQHKHIQFDGLSVYVDETAVDFIEGTTIDLVEKDLGLAQLSYHNPKETARCGCGESFSVKDDL